jgi:metal-responsive CopG/Arc/MetJ family transcriptional regulator
MADYKTIISANIPVTLADRLKNKTKGTRSRVIERALRAYLDDKEAFNISDWETRNLMAVLHAREDVSPQLKSILLAELNS